MKTLLIKLSALLILFHVSLVIISCEQKKSNRTQSVPPHDLNDQLQVGTPEEMGMDSRFLNDAIRKIKAGRFKEIHSVLIFKNNKLLFEEYFDGHIWEYEARGHRGEHVEWDENRKHHAMSCTKSVVSACIGIAIDKGFIKSVHQSVFDYLPKHQHLKANGKKNITIEHLLTMTSGLAWDEWSSSHGKNSSNNIDQLFHVEDPVASVLQRNWWAPPGEYFTYNGGGMIVLGEILKNASGMNLDEFSMMYLFEPLGVNSTLWWEVKDGIVDGAGSLQITSRDMLKFGVLYLNSGAWNDQQILSPNWIEKSAVPYQNNHGIRRPIEDSGESGYAYTWWTKTMMHKGKAIDTFSACGWGGQLIMVIPELDMVLVLTGGNYKTTSKTYKLIREYILSSVT